MHHTGVTHWYKFGFISDYREACRRNGSAAAFERKGSAPILLEALDTCRKKGSFTFDPETCRMKGSAPETCRLKESACFCFSEPPLFDETCRTNGSASFHSSSGRDDIGFGFCLLPS
mmetsp:Transcript_8273/g.15016  ORF Transcript_8273/g.15016 Transcript_8273/m.15016 type:complete len:117 (-) Transcript_8273:319-669(-)